MMSPIDPLTFRRALASFATGVTVVTTRSAEGRPIGLTASSFNSVSLDPPLVLWSVARQAGAGPAFERAGHWTVHVLGEDQQALSDRFGRPLPPGQTDRFAGIEWQPGVGGAPQLEGCVARLQCRRHACHDGGDHLILVGEVLALQCRSAAPLVFHGGRYARLAQAPQPV